MKKLIILITLGLLGTVVAPRASAENAVAKHASAPSEIDSRAAETTVVRLDGKPLFRVRGMAGYSSEDRADAITDRIESVAADASISPDSIALVTLADRSNIMVGENVLASISEADAAVEKIPRSLLAERARLNIVEAVQNFRRDRSGPVLIRRTTVAVTATLILGLFFLGFTRFFRRLLVTAENRIKSRAEVLEKRSSHVIDSRTLWNAFLSILNAVRFVAVAAALYLYFNFVLGLFPWTRPLAAQLFMIFIRPLQSVGLSFVKSVPNLAFLLVLFLVFRYLLKITHLFFSAIDRGTIAFKDFEPEWAWPTYRIVRLLVMCFGLVVAYPHIPGSNSGAFQGISVFVGVLFSLGSTSFIANVIGGIALTYRRAFRLGDVIRVGDTLGQVTAMKVQAIHVRTVKNENIVLPNSVVINGTVINYSTLAKEDGLIIPTTVGIGYEVPWRQVEAMLIAAAHRTTGLRKDKKPFILQRVLDTFCIQYELNVYCDAPLTRLEVLSELHRNILDEFNDKGVQIMTPAYEGDPATPKVAPKVPQSTF